MGPEDMCLREQGVTAANQTFEWISPLTKPQSSSKHSWRKYTEVLSEKSENVFGGVIKTKTSTSSVIGWCERVKYLIG